MRTVVLEPASSCSQNLNLTLCPICPLSSARVSVTLANAGEDAFQHKTYGDQITIERTINKEGGGSYKIKNAEGKTVDTKKATLDQIRAPVELSTYPRRCLP